MRDLLRELPRLLVENKGELVPSDILFNIILSTQASKTDATMTKKQHDGLQDLQKLYLELVEKVRGRRATARFLQDIASRSAIINKADRITGNAVTVVVDEIMKETAKGLSVSNIQMVMETFIHSQILVPERYADVQLSLQKVPPRSRSIMKNLLRIVSENREDI